MTTWGVIALFLIVGTLITAGVWGAAWGKPIPKCEGQISAITEDGKITTEWYPKGCYRE